jgi:hypothetical protein
MKQHIPDVVGQRLARVLDIFMEGHEANRNHTNMLLALIVAWWLLDKADKRRELQRLAEITMKLEPFMEELADLGQWLAPGPERSQ